MKKKKAFFKSFFDPMTTYASTVRKPIRNLERNGDYSNQVKSNTI